MRSNRRLFLLIGICLSSVGFAQETASIRGSVKNALDGAPIVRAHVTVQSGNSHFGALTDAGGNFTITGLAPGYGFVSVDRVGFARVLQPQQIELKAGEKKTGMDLKLTPTGGVTGTVFDPEGQPVQMADVSAIGGDDEISVRTDNHGHYRLGGLNPGKYRVKASVPSRPLPPETRSDGTEDAHYPAVYYPGVRSSKEATRVAVQPSQDTQGIDLRLIASPIIRVSGKVVNAPPGPVGLELYYETSRNSGQGTEQPIGPDGSFVFWGLDPGKYTLTARGSGGRIGPQSAPTEITVGTANLDGIELRMVEPFEIVGRIQFEDEEARKKATPPQEVPVEDRPLHVVLHPTAERSSFSSAVGADSTFHVEKVPPGKYRVQMNVYGGAFVKSMAWGAVQIDGDLLDTQKGSARSELVVTLSAKTAKLHGTVSDAKGPVANVTVHVLTEGNDLPVPTDRAGKFSLDDLPPGTYRILAIDKSLDEIAFQRDGDFSDYEDSMVKVEAHAGDDITQDLKLTTTN